MCPKIFSDIILCVNICSGIGITCHLHQFSVYECTTLNFDWTECVLEKKKKKKTCWLDQHDFSNPDTSSLWTQCQNPTQDCLQSKSSACQNSCFHAFLLRLMSTMPPCAFYLSFLVGAGLILGAAMIATSSVLVGAWRMEFKQQSFIVIYWNGNERQLFLN